MAKIEKIATGFAGQPGLKLIIAIFSTDCLLLRMLGVIKNLLQVDECHTYNLK